MAEFIYELCFPVVSDNEEPTVDEILAGLQAKIDKLKEDKEKVPIACDLIEWSTEDDDGIEISTF